MKAVIITNTESAYRKKKFQRTPLHLNLERLIEFCFLLKRNENEDRGQAGQTGNSEKKEKRRGLSLVRKSRMKRSQLTLQ